MQKPRKLLIVDRQSENREGLCALLRDGYKLVTADHGQDAMAHLEQEPDITLALINMTLPDMEGYRVLGQIRRGGAQVRTLALVEASSPGSREQALALGADCFITGEVRHHEALDALDRGCCIIEAGHFETENPVCEVLADALQKAADAVQYNVTVFCLKDDPFGR